MRSVCFFASYFKSRELPYYIRIYLQELKRHFTEVVLLTAEELGEESRDFLNARQINCEVEQNEGFDFGLWYKALQKRDLGNYDKLALVNDSAILFKPLDDFFSWVNRQPADAYGMTRSDAIAPHLQSYFLVFNKACLSEVGGYFRQQGVLQKLSDVIKTYEIGLSTFLLSKGYKLAAFVDNKGYKGEFSPYYYCVEHHLSQGIPLIKKKILFGSYRKDELFTLARMNFNIDAHHYVSWIKKHGNPLIIDFNQLKEDVTESIGAASRIKYNFNKRIIPLVRILRSR